MKAILEACTSTAYMSSNSQGSKFDLVICGIEILGSAADIACRRKKCFRNYARCLHSALACMGEEGL